MVPSLTDCYHRLGFQVTESEDGLRIGFKPGMAHAIVKEIWNEQPLTRSDVERFYEKLSSLNKGYRNLYFRIVAHGGFLPEALDFELHGLTDKERAQILSINMANNPSRKYKEVWIGLGGSQSAVYATEVSLEEYMCYTTEETEKLELMRLTEKLGGNIELAIRQLADSKRSQVKGIGIT